MPGSAASVPRLASRSSLERVRTCDFCGRREDEEPDDLTRLAWTTAVENGRRRTFCAACSREHLRSAEARLDSEWW